MKQKHLLTLLILSVCVSFRSFAQQVLHFDSLLKAEQTYKLADHKRAELLLKLAQGYSHINPELGIKKSIEARALAESLANKNVQGLGWLSEAINRIVLFDKPGAEYALQSAQLLANNSNETYLKASTAFAQAEANRLLFSSPAKAEAFYKSAIEGFLKLAKQDELARAYRGLAMTYLTRRQDSIAFVYNDKSFQINQKNLFIPGMAANYNTYGLLYESNSNYSLSLENYKKAKELFEKIGYKYALAETYANLGSVYYKFNDYPTALDFYQKALSLDESLKNANGMGKDHYLLSSLYGAMRKLPVVYENLLKAESLFEKIDNERFLGLTYGNMGVYHSINKDFTKAIEYYERAIEIIKQQEDNSELPNLLGKIASLYDDMGETEKSFQIIDEAIQQAIVLRNEDVLAKLYNNKAAFYWRIKKYQESNQYSNKALKISEQHNFLNSKRIAYVNLSSAYKELKQYDSALYFYEKAIDIQKQIFNTEKTEAIARKQAQFEFDKKEASYIYEQSLRDEKIRRQNLLAIQQAQELELNQKQIALINQQKETEKLSRLKALADLQREQLEKERQAEKLTLLEKDKAIQDGIIETQRKQQQLQDLELKTKSAQRNWFIAALLLLLLLLFFVFRNYSNQVKSNQLISKEKQVSEDLLLNILPEQVAQELKTSGKAKARYYEQITVMFTDFVNFTGLSESMAPEDLVNEIDRCFKAFDEIMERHGLEKIKTIGDAYLAVCGLPKPKEDHAQRVLKAAIDIREFMQGANSVFKIRIGIHTGGVVAGIVGSKKYAYDIWGDTVNTAARLEQSSEPGFINVSSATYEIAKKEFDFQYRGKVKAKNKGEIDMYFLNSSH